MEQTGLKYARKLGWTFILLAFTVICVRDMPFRQRRVQIIKPWILYNFAEINARAW